jgi:hypothetical protein
LFMLIILGEGYKLCALFRHNIKIEHKDKECLVVAWIHLA